MGGGAIFVPLLILIGYFEPSTAASVSQTIVLGGAVAVFIFSFPRRHPKFDRPLVDYMLALVLLPPSLIGSLLGTIVNQILPQWLIVVLSFLVLGLVTWNAIHRAISMWRDETNAMKSSENPLELQPSFKSPFLAKKEEKYMTLDKSKATASPDIPLEVDALFENYNELDKIKKKERTIPWLTFAAIIFLALVASVHALLIGGKDWSLLNIKVCSTAYWLGNGALIPVMIIASVVISLNLTRIRKRKERLGHVFLPGDVRWTPWLLCSVPIGALIGGFIASLLGFGGGIIYSPLIIEMGLLPDVAVATSSFIILWTSFATVARYIFLDILYFDYAVLFFLVGLVSSFIGQFTVSKIIQKYKRRSFVLWIMVCFFGIACFLTIATAISVLVQNVIFGGWGFRDLCN
jgi:uncharacterized membrane protein YfcA